MMVKLMAYLAQAADGPDEQAKGDPDAMEVDKAGLTSGVQEPDKPSEDKLKLPVKPPAQEVPDETAAARAKRSRPKAEDLFDSPGGEDVDMFQFDG